MLIIELRGEAMPAEPSDFPNKSVLVTANDRQADKDGFVDRDEFEAIMTRPDVQSKMEILELP